MKHIIGIAILLLITFVSADFPGFETRTVWMPPIPEGPANASSIGRALTILGDINGDGYDDVAIGAEMGCDTATGAVTGKVYIYFGKPISPLSLSELPDMILTGEHNADWFGHDVTGGDFNGDGYDDIGVLAQNIWGNSKVYIYFGGSVPDDIPDITFTTTTSQSFAGKIAFIGDFNDDSYEDIAFPMKLTAQYKVLICHGSDTPDLIPDDTLAPILGFHPALGYGGDINGDGIDDLLVGDFNYSDFDSGIVYIFLGGNPVSTAPSGYITGVDSADQLGWEVAIIGDINNDGFADIGAICASPFVTPNPQCRVYWGSDSGVYEYASHIDGEPASKFGSIILGMGDINDDDHDDFIIGVPSNSAVGKAYIFYGDSLAPTAPSVTLYGEGKDDYFGYYIAAGGDINGNGYNDLAIGAYTSHLEGYYSGKVYIYSGKLIMMGMFEPQVEFVGQPARGWGGYTVASGDINGDGFNDIAFTHEPRKYSEVYLYLGNAAGLDLEREPDYILTDSMASSAHGSPTYFGSSIDFGDFNGDGIDDLAIGIPWWDAIADDWAVDGEVRIYFGGDPFSSSPDVFLHCSSTWRKHFGQSVSFTGDINGDGAEELLVGAPEYYTYENKGYAYLFFGNNGSDTLPNVIYESDINFTEFGNIVIGPGDMTGDSIPDIAISTHKTLDPTSSYGKVYVFDGAEAKTHTGGPIPFSSAIATYEDTLYDFIGMNIAAPGDLNGDRYADLLVTCRSKAIGNFGAGNGAVRIYWGSDSLSPSDYYEITAPASDDSGFGTGIGEIGDVNFDGYPDFAIGAPNGRPNFWVTYNSIAVVGHGGTDRVYIYYGGNPLDCDYDIVLNSPKGHEMFGSSICAAGITSDYDSCCFIIGAPGNSMAGYEAGKVYLLSTNITSVPEVTQKPKELRLNAYPNPFNSSLSIDLVGARHAVPLPADIEIFDINGRMVYAPSPSVPLPVEEGGKTLLPSGEGGSKSRMRAFIWTPDESLGSGVYLVRATVGDKSVTKKVVYLK